MQHVIGGGARVVLESDCLREGDQWTVDLQKTGGIPYICV
jgi:hypothetical protein